jgi:hypothetical protein
MVLLFSVQHSVGRLSRVLQGLTLIDAMSSACWKKKEKKRSSQGLFSQGQRPDTPCWPFWAGFLRLLGAIKG